ncbi:MAG: hypothetical protein B7X31_13905 [Thiomonas sp. 13-66-29]|jgi:hypothetical protein|nr:MAG: hypothetical protein B7X31_13905 [Thiomonas sp. 13-66-29]
MKKQLAAVFLGTLLALGLGLRARADRDGDHDRDARSKPESAGIHPNAAPSEPLIRGAEMLELSKAAQALAGLQTQPLRASHHVPETQAYATVVDLQPLIDWRGRYQDAQAQMAITQSAATAAAQTEQRLRSLYQTGRNASLQAVQSAQATLLADQARAEAAQANARMLLDSARQQWGMVLTRWAAEPHASPFEALALRQQVLLRVILPMGSAMEHPPARIHVAGPDRGAQASALFISASPQADAYVQEPVYFYRTPAGTLASGMRLVADLPQAGTPTGGVLIPASALVWHADQPWVFIQTDAMHFARIRVSEPVAVQGGWFVHQGFHPGQAIVTTGAQTLLSAQLAPKNGSGAGDDDDD